MSGYESWMAAIGPTLTAEHGENNNSDRSGTKPKESKRTKKQNHNQVNDPSVYTDKCHESLIEEMLRIVSEKETEIKELKESNKEAAQKITVLKDRNEKAEQRIRDTERRSNVITSGMAKVMDMKGNFENINDEFANSKISEKFYKLYDHDWVKMSMCLGKYLDMPELDIIHHLTELMMFGYEECLRLANSQIRQLFLLNENDPNPSQNEYQELFALRRQYARTEAVRERLTHTIWEKLIKMRDMNLLLEKNRPQALELLQKFFNKYIDCCWLMVVSNPPVMLNFNVIGKPHADCSEYFRVFALKRPVMDSTKEKGTICEVVWPSVCHQDGSACYKKGDVAIVTEGRKADNTVNNNSTEALGLQRDGTN